MRELTKEDKEEIAKVITEKLRMKIKRGSFEMHFSPEGTPVGVKITVNR